MRRRSCCPRSRKGSARFTSKRWPMAAAWSAPATPSCPTCPRRSRGSATWRLATSTRSRTPWPPSCTGRSPHRRTGPPSRQAYAATPGRISARASRQSSVASIETVALHSMRFHEILLVGLLCVLIGGAIWKVYRDRDHTLFWNPLTLFSAIFAYYFVIGPLISLGFHNTFAYGIDLRDMMWKSWLAGLVGLGSIFTGFAIKIRPYRARLVTGARGSIRRCYWYYFWVLI